MLCIVYIHYNYYRKANSMEINQLTIVSCRDCFCILFYGPFSLDCHFAFKSFSWLYPISDPVFISAFVIQYLMMFNFEGHSVIVRPNICSVLEVLGLCSLARREKKSSWFFTEPVSGKEVNPWFECLQQKWTPLKTFKDQWWSYIGWQIVYYPNKSQGIWLQNAKRLNEYSKVARPTL